MTGVSDMGNVRDVECSSTFYLFLTVKLIKFQIFQICPVLALYKHAKNGFD